MDEVVQIGLVLLNIFPASKQAGQPQRCSLLGHALVFSRRQPCLWAGLQRCEHMPAHCQLDTPVWRSTDCQVASGWLRQTAHIQPCPHQSAAWHCDEWKRAARQAAQRLVGRPPSLAPSTAVQPR